jgi:PAS domain S-box-containing protein
MLKKENFEIPNDKLQILYDFEQQVHKLVAFDEILALVLDVAVYLTETEKGSLLLFDKDSGNFYLRARKDEANETSKTMLLKANVTNISQVFESQKPVQFYDEKIVTGFSARALMCVSLVSKREILGILCVSNQKEMKRFSKTDEYLLSRIANYASLVITLDNAERKVKAYSGISSISQTMLFTEHLENALENIAENAMNILGADNVILYEYDRSENDIKIPPARAGNFYYPGAILRKRDEGVIIAHKNSVVFKLLNEQDAIYAENGVKSWISKGFYPEMMQDEQERTFMGREKIISSIGIPLLFAESPQGVLFINFRKPTDFSLELRITVNMFARIAAIAIHNAKLKDVATQISSITTLSIDQIAEMIYSQSKKLLPIKNFYIALYDENKKTYTFPIFIDEHDKPPLAEDTKLQNSLTDYIRKTRKPLLVDRKTHNTLSELESVNVFGTDSLIWMGAPLESRGKILGVIAVQDYESDKSYTNDHLMILTSIAYYSAHAIDNLYVIKETYDRISKYSSELVKAREFDNRSADAIMYSIIKNAVELTGAQAGSFILCHKAKKETEIKISYNSEELEKLKGLRIKYGDGVSGKVALSGSPLIVNDYENWEGRVSVFETDPYKGILKAVVGVPVLDDTGVIGVLTLSDNRPNRYFSDDDVNLLMKLVKPAGELLLLWRLFSLSRTLIENSPDAVIAVDNGGKINQFNSYAETILGYKREEVIGTKVFDLYWGKINEARKIDFILKQKGSIKFYETYLKNKLGEKIPISLSASQIFDLEGNVIGSIGNFIDMRIKGLRGKIGALFSFVNKISKETEIDALLQTILLESAYVFQADEGRIIYLKDKTIYSLNNNSLNNFDKIVNEDIIQRAIQSLEPQYDPFFVKPKTTSLFSERTQSVLVLPLSSNNRCLSVIILENFEVDHFQFEKDFLEFLTTQSSESITKSELQTERSLTQGQLMASQRIAMAGQLAAGVSHEVYNCLNNISLTVDDVRDSLEGENLKNKGELLDTIRDIKKEVDRLSVLNRGVHQVSLKLEPHKDFYNLNDLVSETYNILHGSLNSKKINFVIKLDDRLNKPAIRKGYLIFADKGQIQQVIINFTMNAIEASRERGKMIIETLFYPKKQEAEFRIRDFGDGIKPEIRKNLFKPFFTTKADGTGLGLYITQIIIQDNHQGKIDFRSVPQKGTTFSFFLPIIAE